MVYVVKNPVHQLNRKSRTTNLYHILRVCRKNGWNYGTPNLAGKLENLLKLSGFTKRTKRDYVEAIIGILQLERQYGIDLSWNYAPRYEEKRKSSVHREAKSGRKDVEDSNSVIYSSPVLPSPSHMYR